MIFSGRPQHPAGVQQEARGAAEGVAHQLDGGGAAEEGAGAARGLPLREGHQSCPLHRLCQQGARPLLQHGQRAVHSQVVYFYCSRYR